MNTTTLFVIVALVIIVIAMISVYAFTDYCNASTEEFSNLKYSNLPPKQRAHLKKIANALSNNPSYLMDLDKPTGNISVDYPIFYY